MAKLKGFEQQKLDRSKQDLNHKVNGIQLSTPRQCPLRLARQHLYVPLPAPTPTLALSN